MKRSYIYEEPRVLTVGELCEALIDGNLQAQLQDGAYAIRKSDLVRFAKSPAPRRGNLRLLPVNDLSVANVAN
ncbi:MAG TPA: hypothetical protein VM409_02580 [Chloroflexia bacterium]|nr:hypothetical protein [Chloroflexia bacterium]